MPLLALLLAPLAFLAALLVGGALLLGALAAAVLAADALLALAAHAWGAGAALLRLARGRPETPALSPDQG